MRAEAFATAWTEGRTMPLEEAMANALETREEEKP
jgi:hypothetical protein